MTTKNSARIEGLKAENKIDFPIKKHKYDIRIEDITEGLNTDIIYIHCYLYQITTHVYCKLHLNHIKRLTS
jgi:hypothetical protein